MIRANRNSVEDWLHRIDLYSNDSSIISVFEEAITAINPEEAIGQLSQIWI